MLGLIALALAGCGADTASTPRGTPTATPALTPVESAVERLDVLCGGSTTKVTRRMINAGTRGLLARISGPGVGHGLYLAYSYRTSNDGQPGGGEPVPADGMVTIVIPPGPAEVACQNDGADPVDPQTVQVLDPRGLYTERGLIERTLDCDRIGQASTSSSGPLSVGRTAAEAASHVAQLNHAQLGPRGSGYIDQSPQEFILTREGKDIGTAQAFRSSDGWTAGTNWICA